MTHPQEQIVKDIVDPARIAALNAVLGLPRNDAPPFAHQIFFWDAQPEAVLGRDGHPKTGGIIPDLGLPRRMWAGGHLTFHRGLIAGVTAEKRTRRLKAERKQGRSGPLGVVTLQHEILQNGQLVVEDRQDLIYREEASPQAAQPAVQPAPSHEDIAQTRRFSTTQLFRYSALTFNGHRIHYDRDYAQTVEGYPGLVVHGPLLAQYLMLLAEGQLGVLKRFEFRATAPLFDFEEASFCAASHGGELEMWVRAEDGRLCMTASAQ